MVVLRYLHHKFDSTRYLAWLALMQLLSCNDTVCCKQLLELCLTQYASVGEQFYHSTSVCVHTKNDRECTKLLQATAR